MHVRVYPACIYWLLCMYMYSGTSKQGKLFEAISCFFREVVPISEVK